jgi:hypothetical protein
LDTNVSDDRAASSNPENNKFYLQCCGNLKLRIRNLYGEATIHRIYLLKMEAAYSSEKLVSNHHTTRRNNSENHEL